MMQQVNLLTDDLRPQIEPLTVPQVTMALAGLALLLLLYSAWQGLQVWQLSNAQGERQTELQTLTESNTRLRAAVAADPQPALVAEVETLRALFENQSVMIDAVRGYEQVSASGFSGYLHDLAAQHVDGMALQRIELHDGGSHILLSGEAAAPIHVPQFLKRLSGGASFQGHRFNQLKLETQASGRLRFDIVGPEPERSG